MWACCPEEEAKVQEEVEYEEWENRIGKLETANETPNVKGNDKLTDWGEQCRRGSVMDDDWTSHP